MEIQEPCLMNSFLSKPCIENILIVEDEARFAKSLEITLKSLGYPRIDTCLDSRDAVSKISENRFDMIFLDLVMPHISGEKILEESVGLAPDIPVIMISGVDEVDTAVRCIKKGAFDYIVKPADRDRVSLTVNRAKEVLNLRRENESLKRHIIEDGPDHPEMFSECVTQDPKMIKLFQYCEAVAPGHFPVLITGETGVGKDVLAGIIHRLSGRTGDYVTVNAAGVDDTVFSDTLFGHEKGAFTGADRPRPGLVRRAHGGTLFLDEIGDLNQTSQIKLLRLLEQGEFFPIGSDKVETADVRFIVSTHRDFADLTESGCFRRDLYYRLHTHHIHIPPLRERMNDLPMLLDHFIGRALSEFGRSKQVRLDEIVDLLKTCVFSGNIRELKSVVFDAVGRETSDRLTARSFNHLISPDVKQDDFVSEPPISEYESAIGRLKTLPGLKESALCLTREALKRTNNNQRAAAKLLGVTPQALNQRLKRENDKQSLPEINSG